MSKKVLIVESRYYEDIANLLLEATIEELNFYNVKFDKIEVLGALEIPILIKKAIISNKYDGFIANTKAWMDNFDDITYEANVWLPGTDSLGVLNGSVRTYGVWTAKNTMTGNVIKTNAYH